MARRKRQTIFEDLIEISSMMPWWAALLAAIASYLVLHRFVVAPIQTATTIGQLGSNAGLQLWRILAMFGQYVLPAAFGFGAVISAIKAAKTKQRFINTAELGTRAGLLEMSWQQFEGLVAEYFRREGYKVSATGRAGPDGGVDIELRRGSELALVQCKQWRATRVGVEIVRELFGVMAARGATQAYVVSAGQFTPDAIAFSVGRNIRLIDGNQLIADMRSAVLTQSFQGISKDSSPGMTAKSMSCPTCGSTMVLRTARKGPNAGNQFWGCSTYPRCTGIRVV